MQGATKPETKTTEDKKRTKGEWKETTSATSREATNCQRILL